MDWAGVIDKQGKALRRVIDTLLAMAGLGDDPRVEWEGFEVEDLPPPDPAPADRPTPPPTLPRRIHRAVLRLLRPAEAAARRLVIVAARDIVVALPAPPRRPGSAAPLQRGRSGCRPAAPAALAPRKLSLPLFDPLYRPCGVRRPPRRGPGGSGVPRITFPGLTERDPVAPWRAPMPDDEVDATRLGLRLDALVRVLDDLPAQARRFARWRARAQAIRIAPAVAAAQRPARRARTLRVQPLRPGRAWGLHRPGHRRREHAVDEILRDLHYFAWAAQQPDTS